MARGSSRLEGLILLALAAAGGAAAAAAPYRLVEAQDQSQGDFFKAVFTVEVDQAPDAAGAEAVARDLVERRLRRRALHVAEVRLRIKGAGEGGAPAALVIWAPAGDPARRPAGPPGDYSTHSYTVTTGAAAARAAEAAERSAPAAPPAVPAAPAPAPVRPAEGTPVLTATPPPPIPSNDARALARAEALALVRGWKSSWQARDLDSYLAYYHPDFRSGAMDLAAWGAHKATVFAATSAIAVELSEIEVDVAGDEAVVRFVQDYRSDAIADRGRKTLRLRRHGGGFKIVGEDWARL